MRRARLGPVPTSMIVIPTTVFSVYRQPIAGTATLASFADANSTRHLHAGFENTASRPPKSLERDMHYVLCDPKERTYGSERFPNRERIEGHTWLSRRENKRIRERARAPSPLISQICCAIPRQCGRRPGCGTGRVAVGLCAFDQFKEQARMSTWLTSIVLNSARMQLRQRGRRTYLPIDDEPRDEDRETLSVQIADDRPSPEEECCAAELKEHLKPLITRLSDNLRQTFELRHFDGLSIRETARRLKVPVGTVKARLTRARSRLQRRVRSLTLAPRPGHCLPPPAGDSSTRAEFGDRKIKFKKGKSRVLARSLLRKAPPSDST